MADHKCEHEVDLAVMAEKLKTVADDVTTIKDLIVGNGKPGISFRIRSLEDRRKADPTPRQVMLYATIGGGGVFALSAAGSALVKLMSGG